MSGSRESEGTPVNWARLRQRYTSLTCRRQPVLNTLVFSGIVVEAADPKELVAETKRVLGDGSGPRGPRGGRTR